MTASRLASSFVATAFLATLAVPSSAAVRMPRVSPAASVSQDLGLTTLKIQYHRPAVKGRKIWGGLVPYGQVWRLGANNATTISFNSPVRIGGTELPAGTYSIFVGISDAHTNSRLPSAHAQDAYTLFNDQTLPLRSR